MNYNDDSPSLAITEYVKEMNFVFSVFLMWGITRKIAVSFANRYDLKCKASIFGRLGKYRQLAVLFLAPFTIIYLKKFFGSHITHVIVALLIILKLNCKDLFLKTNFRSIHSTITIFCRHKTSCNAIISESTAY